MLPVGTPPNAIVFAAGKLTVRDMLKAGIWLSLAGMAIVALFVSLFVR